MVWGAFSCHGCVPLHRVQATLRSPQYLEILQSKVVPFMNAHPHSVFQQDNAPCHKARIIMPGY
jgi:hypothetical protein